MDRPSGEGNLKVRHATSAAKPRRLSAKLKVTGGTLLAAAAVALTGAMPVHAATTPPSTAAQAEAGQRGATPATAAGDVDASAVIYWAFRNDATDACLSTYASGAIRSVPCDASARAQEWHWINVPGSSERMLKNRWTERCLVATSPVTSGDCRDRSLTRFVNLANTHNGSYWIINGEDLSQKYLYDRPVDDHVGMTGDVDAARYIYWYMQERDRG
ncbi:hypothetical protein Misp01_21570 [Microtetraspora sp. NBRC 13810]|uniref:hypothetical protein n=1 Tax=Microtetraspora sp. NBRC 13810 TaxID=3030990 RepID=UPI0024A505F7|nr:hypothetical protein [Microtetraspora sp. NBRC 13810]GLW07027.1 hypothetical protein Misp01_21570 [Microtetraspora sp. NBRC 13810]